MTVVVDVPPLLGSHFGDGDPGLRSRCELALGFFAPPRSGLNGYVAFGTIVFSSPTAR